MKLVPKPDWMDWPLAEFSDDTEGPDGRGAYRYTLWRRNLQANYMFLPGMNAGQGLRAENATKFVMFLCLNPSTATETEDDRTIGRCTGFAQRWGYHSFCMANIFALRATLPDDMKAHRSPTGDPRNMNRLYDLAQRAGVIVCGWGCHGAHLGRAAEIRQWLRAYPGKVHALRFTQGGHPEHPLYIPNETKLQPMPL